jgi:hypothetical protein
MKFLKTIALAATMLLSLLAGAQQLEVPAGGVRMPNASSFSSKKGVFECASSTINSCQWTDYSGTVHSFAQLANPTFTGTVRVGSGSYSVDAGVSGGLSAICGTTAFTPTASQGGLRLDCTLGWIFINPGTSSTETPFGSGTGGISITGTPTAHQPVVWVDSTHAKGVTAGTNDQIYMGSTGADPVFVNAPSGGTNGCTANSDIPTYNSVTHAWGCRTITRSIAYEDRGAFHGATAVWTGSELSPSASAIIDPVTNDATANLSTDTSHSLTSSRWRIPNGYTAAGSNLPVAFTYHSPDTSHSATVQLKAVCEPVGATPTALTAISFASLGSTFVINPSSTAGATVTTPTQTNSFSCADGSFFYIQVTLSNNSLNGGAVSNAGLNIDMLGAYPTGTLVQP